jgi:hypothetical protein
MAMTKSNIWLHEQSEALKKPSFIKNIQPELSENSASWLIERLSKLSSPYSSDDIDAIFNMFEKHWGEFTEIEAEEAIEGGPESSPILNGIIDRSDYKYGAHFEDDQAALEDKKCLKTQICDQYDDLCPSSLERFHMLLDFTDWDWIYTTEFGDNMEVESYEVAIVVAVEMLGSYLQSLLHKEEHKQSGILAFDIDEVHQTLHLAQQFKSTHELHSTKLSLQSEIPKKAFSKRAAQGGKAKASKKAGLKQHLFDLYEARKHSFKSLLQAAHELKTDADEYCEKHSINRLAPTNSQRTIYDWLRKYQKTKKSNAY